MSFKSFDPLKHKTTAETEVAANALKREIKEILGSYVGWFDPFNELIQNSLDSVEQRKEQIGKTKIKSKYVPTVNIRIDIKNHLIIVSDNGVGLDEKQFNQFLVPFFSFKSGKTRGHKGVGATYLAYGFNYIQVSTKTNTYTTCGKMVNARKWLSDLNPSGNPEVKFDSKGPLDKSFDSFDQGVSIAIKFDNTTSPKDLDYLKTSDPKSWMKILRIKTGLGAIIKNDDIVVNLTILDEKGKSRNIQQKGIEYLYVQQFDNVSRAKTFRELQIDIDKNFKKSGLVNRLPSSLQNFDCLYDNWESKELEKIVDVDDEEKEIILQYAPRVYCGFAYSTKVFNDFNDSLKIRAKYKIITGGFQVASNNMPQGEIYQIPLLRYTGRQNQIHFVFHFDNYSPDLGRKGYNKEIIDFCKSMSEKITTKFLLKYKNHLRASTGADPDIIREKKVSDWKKEMEDYENKNPLVIKHEKFFLPTKMVGITSKPSREQDVISLFNQLIAGGVIRGIRIMSTNERFTYDGLYRIIIEKPTHNHIYNKKDNPLGILADKFDVKDLPFTSNPSILEYKFTLDGLIEDISTEDKNSNDIGLVVVWNTGELYNGNYHITSLLDVDNLSGRQYHGVTHTLTNVTTNQKEMDLIVLEELIDYLNEPEKTIKAQKEKYG